ncbi:MAG TPA: hypothetical protein VK797_22160 [Tepidisphaeraceae bacterium]|jgi:hypothetical protein|nr:hypothetical protein [Tepidisphaeraceae bacterium]
MPPGAGSETPSAEQSNFTLMPEGVAKLKSEVETLIADRAILWRFPDALEPAKTNIVAVLDKIAVAAIMSTSRSGI